MTASELGKEETGRCMLLETFVRSEGNTVLSSKKRCYPVKDEFLFFKIECSLKVDTSEAILRKTLSVILRDLWCVYTSK